MRDLVRHAAEQKALGAGHSLVADHDQVGVFLLGHVENRVGGIALARVSLDVHAGVAQRSGRVLERFAHVLARVDHPLQVTWHLLAFLLEAPLGHRLVGAHQVNLRANVLCKL